MGSDIPDRFLKLAETGDVSAAKDMVREFGVKVLRIQWGCSYRGVLEYKWRVGAICPLARACRHGHREFAEWLVGAFDKKTLAEGGVSFDSPLQLLEDACTYGHANIAGWLVEYYPFEKNTINRTLPEYSLIVDAAKNGNLGVMKVLARSFSLRYPHPPHAEDEYEHLLSILLNRAAERGDLPMAKWLLKEFESDYFAEGSPVLDSIHDIAKFAKDLSCLETVQFIVGAFGPKWFGPPGDAIVKACRTGDADAAEWLTGTLGPYPAEIGWCALCETSSEGRLEMVKWVCARFGLEAAEISSENNAALRKALENGHNHVARWITDNYDVFAESGA